MRNEGARAEAHARSNGTCQLCGWEKSKHAHHWALRYPDEEDLVGDDLTALCKWCHEMATELRRYMGKGVDTARALAAFGEALRDHERHSPVAVSADDEEEALKRSNGRCQICGRPGAIAALAWSQLYSKLPSIQGGQRLTALCGICHEVAIVSRCYLHAGYRPLRILQRFCAAFDVQAPLFESSGMAPPPIEDRHTFGGPPPASKRLFPHDQEETEFFPPDEPPVSGQTSLHF